MKNAILILAHKEKRFLWLLALLVSLTCAYGADSTLVRLANTVNRFNRVFPQEKVYLHFDNTGYFIGENMWFKAYLQSTDKEGLGSRSRVLYVELIDPSGNVLMDKKLKIEKGTAHGNFPLNNIPLSGFYEVRAYTRYMLNWGRDAVFSRVFPIFDRPDKVGNYDKRVIEQEVSEEWLPNKAVAEPGTERKFNVRFYPEGGNIVAGQDCRVAFECLDKSGRRLQANGWLLDGDSRIVSVATQMEGRGVFSVRGKRGDGLKLSLMFGKRGPYVFPLPKAVDEGATMRVDVMGKDSVRWHITTSDALNGRPLGQLFLHNGKMYHLNIVTGQQNTGAMAFADMPAGVNQIALTDTAGNIFSNRLVFVYPRRADVDTVCVSANDSTIWPCKSMTMEIKASPQANFSFSVCDAQTQTGGWTHNAATWLLLTSDLRGYVDHPEYYIESDDSAHRSAADLLMMVQGWRRYNVKMMEGKEMFTKRYPIEDRLYIDGQLKQRQKKNTVDNVELGLVLSNEQSDQIAGQTVTNDKGFYAFAVPDCYGQWNLMMMTRKGNKDIDYYVTINRHFSPEVGAKDWLQLNSSDTIVPSFGYTLSKAYEDLIPIELRNHWLQNVNVYGRQRWKSARQAWERESRGAAHSIVRYDCQREADKISDSGAEMPTLEEWLKSANPDFAGSNILGGSSNYDGYNDIDSGADPFEDSGNSGYEGGFLSLYEDSKKTADNPKERSFHPEGLTYKNRPIMWIVNNSFFGGTGFNSLRGLPEDVRDKMKMALYVNFPTFLDEARSVYVSVKPDDWMRFIDLPELMGKQYVTVYVYTFMNSSYEKKGLRVTTFEGFDVPSEYEQSMAFDNQTTIQNDYRRTLYWNPTVKLDSNGKAKIRFTSNSTCRYVAVSADGFTHDGRPLVAKTINLKRNVR